MAITVAGSTSRITQNQAEKLLIEALKDPWGSALISKAAKDEAKKVLPRVYAAIRDAIPERTTLRIEARIPISVHVEDFRLLVAKTLKDDGYKDAWVSGGCPAGSDREFTIGLTIVPGRC